MSLLAYADEWSVEPGGSVGVKVSCGDLYSVKLVDVTNPEDRRQIKEELGPFTGKEQKAIPGSMVVVPGPIADLEDWRALTIQMWLLPTMAAQGGQVIAAHVDPARGTGFRLALGEGGVVEIQIQDVAGSRWELGTPARLESGRWYFVALTLNLGLAEGALYWQSFNARSEEERLESCHLGLPKMAAVGHGGPITIGAEPGATSERPGKLSPVLPFDGRIEAPMLIREALGEENLNDLWNGRFVAAEKDGAVLGQWDFSLRQEGLAVADVSGNGLHGKIMNLPTRRVFGRHRPWSVTDWGIGEFHTALHFHSDSLGDADWDTSFEYEVPHDLISGVHVLELESAEGRAEVPLFVRAGQESTRFPIAVLMPTLTYMAYGNHRPRPGDQFDLARRQEVGLKEVLGIHDEILKSHPELGSSLYNTYIDGGGVCYASRYRPVLNVSSDWRWWGTGGPRNFSADLLLLRWLRRNGIEHEIVTDEDLDDHGLELLAPYRTLLTGSHPEYVTARMLEALQGFQDQGRNLVYLGGNGFYWVTSRHPELPGVIEVRRGWSGSRDWSSPIGEHLHSTTGEQGGLWCHRGIAPQELVGVGFCAMGWTGGSGYRRRDDSFRKEVAFIFEGVENEIFGEFVSHWECPVSGAAADEIDRLDFGLGTPESVFWLASSQGMHRGLYQRAIEDVRQHIPGMGTSDDPETRADMVYYELPSGARVFGVGSMNWIPALGQAEDVARITLNVIREFSSSTA